MTKGMTLCSGVLVDATLPITASKPLGKTSASAFSSTRPVRIPKSSPITIFMGQHVWYTLLMENDDPEVQGKHPARDAVTRP